METQIREICSQIDMRKKKKIPFIVAIDGKSGSGKTTLAAMLSEKYDAVMLHMDDFFLRPEQRTAERLKEVGGNVDYERFLVVLEQLRKEGSVIYQPYDCKTGTMKEARMLYPGKMVIAEGSYSMHPFFGEYADYRIGLDIDPEEQKERIIRRNGAEMLTRFVKEWIPKENAYLEAFHIFEKCDIVVKI